jgi:NADH:ubiquinone oxidoreductase subunit 6 (chain J)
MLFNKITSVNISNTSVQKNIGYLVLLIFISGLGYMVANTPWSSVANSEPVQTTEAIGRLLMIDYLLPFEAASLLLLGALIGATTLSRKDD